MYLTSLKLAGFKSFVDPTKIPIRSNMTAIVGPNGCGKSNIVDAIRWVIGESSAKQLRGQSMSDVIFNGTTGRKPVGKATVELHFDNSSGRITGEYAKYTDLVIRREVERDGQSNYFLNGAACRRRDILDVFLGTGLGPRSYSIIEQGMISQLIEAKPDELRAHFEEVAGISKYKERRRETQTRIQHTKDNLDRLNDIREELEKQLRHLKRQANAAEQYKQLKLEERELSAQMKVLQWQALEAKRLEQQEKLNQQLTVREQKIAEQRQYEAELDKIKLDQETAEESQQTVQRRFYQIGEEIARLEQQIKHHQEQMTRWQEEYTNASTMWEELEQSALEHQEQIAELESEVAKLSPEQGSIRSELTQAQQALTQANARMQTWQQQWDQLQQQLAQNNSQLQVTKTKLENQEQQTHQLKERRQKIDARFSQLDVSNLAAALAPLQAELEQAQQALQQAEQALQAYQHQITEQRQTNKNQQQDLQARQHALQRLEAEHAKLSALQQAALGTHDQQSAQWLKNAGLQQHARLGQKLQVTAGWEQAVETVLSGHFDAVCVDSLDAYADSLAGLTQGRITLVDKAASAEPAARAELEPLLSKVRSEWALDALQGIYVANDLASARRLRASLAEHESVITPQGVWFGKNWMRVSHVADATRGTLEREKQIQQLAQQINDAKEAKQTADESLKKGEADLVALEQARDAAQENFKRLNQALGQVRSQWSSKSSQLDSLKAEEKRLQAELADIDRRHQDIERLVVELSAQREQLQAQQTEQLAARDRLAAEREPCQRALEAARQALQKQQQQSDELSIRLSANESQLGLLRQTMQRSEKQKSQLAERREYLEKNLAESGSPAESLNAELQQKLSERLQVEQELKAVEAIVAQHRQRVKELDSAKQQVLEALDKLQQALEALRMQSQEATVRQQTILEQLAETEQTIEAVRETMPAEAAIAPWEARLETITNKINRLGPINLAAIEEFQSGTERKEYLDKQFQDLNESLETLEAAIRKIDRESKTRFRETFDKVNQGFQTIFPQIFGGGRAYLELSEDDLLTTGIFVKAQPPGKKNSTIHLLSGGEKALTAISLIFAMFQLNPAPFCILDEVDAPLDDLNVGRFCAIVKQMSKDTQFLIISHNKVTIESADHLMGVTMQEAGVSRLVAVDVAEALEMVDA